MLVLSRKKQESIVCVVETVDGPVRIVFTVIELSGDKVRLGIEAPRSVAINRDEIQEKIDSRKPA